MTSIREISKSLAALHAEIREGLQRQQWQLHLPNHLLGIGNEQSMAAQIQTIGVSVTTIEELHLND